MPRLRAGQFSIASVAPEVHSAPMPKPNSVRSARIQPNDGAKAMAPSHTANQTSEIMSGNLRPQRSATEPAATPPTRRRSNVSVIELAVAVTPT